LNQHHQTEKEGKARSFDVQLKWGKRSASSKGISQVP